LEQRRAAGRERPLERRSEEQLVQSREWLVHLRPHRAPITATRPTDLLLTGIRLTHSRAMETEATPDSPPTPVLRAMDTQATRHTPPTPDPRHMDRQAIRHTPLTPPLLDTDTRADRYTLPIPMMDLPWLAIPETALLRIGRLEPNTAWSLLAELRPKIHPKLRPCSSCELPPQFDSNTLMR
jgi:hypothetical protein